MRIPLCAPIDINHFAINVASSGRAKKDYNQSDIFRLPNRNLSSRPVLLVFFGRKHPLVDLFRMNDAGGDAVTVTPSLATTRDNDLDQMSVAPFGGIAAFKEIGSSLPVRFDDSPEFLRLHRSNQGVGKIAPSVEIEAHGVFPFVW